jgi:hypothetical protein
MLKIEFENIKNGWIDIILENKDFHYKNRLSTIGLYFTPELFFESVIDLLNRKETYVRLDEESHQDFLFLIPKEKNVINWFLCKPNGKEYNYLDYLNNNVFPKSILEFMETHDTDLTILHKSTSTIQSYYSSIHSYFKHFKDKNGLVEFKEKALVDFNLELFQEMENLIINN